jgi:hypothetical protein
MTQDKQKLTSIIKQKDKIFRSIQDDLKKRYFKILNELKNDKTIQDYEIEPTIEIFEIDGDGDPFFTIYYSGRMFKEKFHNDISDGYDLNIFGIDLKVCHATMQLIDEVRLEGISKQYSFWSQIIVYNQKFFTV